MGRENARARVRQRTRERTAKIRPLRRREAVVANVSNRVIARKLERRQTKKLERGGGGEKRKVSFSPLPSPFISLFYSLPNFLDDLARKRLRRLQRSDSPKCWLVTPFKARQEGVTNTRQAGYIWCAVDVCYRRKYVKKVCQAHLCYGSLKVRWME